VREMDQAGNPRSGCSQKPLRIRSRNRLTPP